MVGAVEMQACISAATEFVTGSCNVAFTTGTDLDTICSTACQAILTRFETDCDGVDGQTSTMESVRTLRGLCASNNGATSGGVQSEAATPTQDCTSAATEFVTGSCNVAFTTATDFYTICSATCQGILTRFETGCDGVAGQASTMESVRTLRGLCDNMNSLTSGSFRTENAPPMLALAFLLVGGWML